MAAVGAGCVVASVPFAVSSVINNRKANLLLRNQTTFITPSFRLTQPQVGIAIPL